MALQVLIKNLFPRKVSSNNLPSIHFLQWRWMITKYCIWKHMRSPSAAIPVHKHTGVTLWRFTKHSPAPVCWSQHQRENQTPEPNTRKTGRKHQELHNHKRQQKPEKSQGWVYVMCIQVQELWPLRGRRGSLLVLPDYPAEPPVHRWVFSTWITLGAAWPAWNISQLILWLLFPAKSRHPTS